MKRPASARRRLARSRAAALLALGVIGALGATSPPLRGDVVLNEIMAKASDRLLRWNAAGVPKLGFGPAWHELSYADDSWPAGNGPFGFGSFANVSPAPAVGTNLATQMVNLTPTAYLRKAFSASAAQATSATNLTFEVQFNDGFVCYLNGVEVARRNAGAANDFKYRDSFAATGTPAHTESTTTPYLRTETISLGAANTRLVAGANLLAVHALNHWENTSLHNTTTNVLTAINNSNNFYFKGDLKLGATTLVANNSSWKYLPGLVEPGGGVYDPALLFAAKQNVPWGRTAFDDSLWPVGAAPFGAGTPPSGVALGTNLTSQLPGQATSLYCRIVFNATATDLADTLPLQLLMDWDDGFVAYLNGVEVARDRLDLANSFVPHDAVASSARGPGSYATYTLDPPARLLAEGPNVLSVQAHNVTLGDADLFMRAQLRTNPSGGNRLLVQATDSWRYFVGVSEPAGAVDGETEDEIDGIDASADWIELRNTGGSPASIAGWGLSDDPDEPGKWTFPAGATIPAGGYLVVLCDDLDLSPPGGGLHHTNFKLSDTGEDLVLSDASGTVIDSVSFGRQTAFESYGRSGAGEWTYLAQPSPGVSNSGDTLSGQVEPVRFSEPPGFYPSARNLTLSTATPGATIRYTLDGTEPTPSTGTAGSSASIAASRAIRAKAFKTGMIPSETATGTFLVNEPAARQSLPALCLVGDEQRSLYRPFGAMAIAGGSWTAFTAPAPTGNNGIWTQTGATPGSAVDLMAYNNPIHRGRFVEKPVNLEILRADGVPGPNVVFGLRIAGSPHARPRYVLTNQNRAPGASPAPNEGAWSATAFTQKPSFNFFFRGDYSEDLEWPLFPGYPVTSFHSLRIRAGKNDVSNPFIEDEYMRRLFLATGQAGSRGMINTLYVNGVYKGYFNLCEHLREKFFQYHYQSDQAWDVRQVTTIASGDGLAFQEMITYLRNSPQTSLQNYEGMRERLDMVNFIDYLLANIVGNTGDWPHNNFVCSRERSPEGRHRYHLWDAEGAFGDFGGNVRTNMFAAGTTGSVVTTNPNGAGLAEGIRILYTLLRQSPEFKLLFADRIQKHFFDGGCFTEARMLAEWNAMKAEFAPIVAPAPVTDRVTPWLNGVGDPARYTTSGATNTPSRRQVLFHGYTDDTAGGVFVPAHFVAEGLWPATLAPRFSQQGGQVGAGFDLVVTNPNGAGAIHYTLDGSDPRAPGGAPQGLVYGGPVELNYSAPVKARVLSSGGEWSPLQEAVFEIERASIHAWEFEHATAWLQPTQTYGGASLAIAPGAATTVERSDASQDFATAHLRVNDPLGAEVRFALPSTGFEHLSLAYETRRSGQGAGLQTVEYTTDGAAWHLLESFAVRDDPPQAKAWSLGHVTAANDNPAFAVRVTFSQGDGGASGNDRFDQVRLSGVPIPGFNFAPVPTPAAPVALVAVAGAAGSAHGLAGWFSDPEEAPLTYGAGSSNPDVATVSVDGGRLAVSGWKAGEAVLTVSADDGVNDPVSTPVRVLVYPAAHRLSTGPHAFGEWSADEPAGNHPAHMLFLQGEEDDATLGTELSRAYHIPPGDAAAPEDADFPYRATSRTRLDGLGGNGVAFLNTGRGRDLGGALLALDTSGLSAARVQFTAGTVAPNTRVYGLRLQYRVGTEGPFLDLPGEGGAPVEYVRNATAGHETILGPVPLPPAALGQACVQLLWRYHLVSGSSGARAQLRLDDVLVGPDAASPPAAVVFNGAPTGGHNGSLLAPVVVRLHDASGFLVSDYDGPVTIALEGAGSLAGTLTVNAVGGVATFSDLLLDGTGAHRLVATAAGLAPAYSAEFRSLSLTGLIVPRFLQGDPSGVANAARVPFAWLARIGGLEPHATYRYANRVVADTDPATSDGAGNMIFVTGEHDPWIRSTDSPRFLASDEGQRHGLFTAGPDGSHTGWFLTEPTGNARFTPGTSVRFRLLLNDGGGGESAAFFLTSDEAATVLAFGPGTGEATGLVGEAASSARKIVVVSDDATGAGRPLSATPVEITGAEVDETYASFYRTLVAPVETRWGTLIPNTLPGGVRRIELRAPVGDRLIGASTAPGGFGGTVDPSGGLAPVLLGGGFDPPFFLPGGDASWNIGANWSDAGVPGGPGAAALVYAPVSDDRDVTLDAPVTMGELRFQQGTTPYRNRIRSTAATFTFHGGGGEALLRVDGLGANPGFVEFEVAGGTHLAGDLFLLVNAPDGSAEYGSLRLREAWTGPGGLVKRGVGTAFLTGAGKTFTGPLVVDEGVLGVTDAGVPVAAASVTVQPGGQLRLVSHGVPEAPALHSFGGGPIVLSGPGRGGALGGENLGVRGALRYEPGSDAGRHAAISNGLHLAAATDVHVGGASNRLLVSGPLTGAALLTKSGGGGLELAGASAAPAPPLSIENGRVTVTGDHPAAVAIGAGGVLSGNGSVGEIGGEGLVSIAGGALEASRSRVSRLAFVLSNPDGFAGNGALALSDPEPFPLAPGRIDLYLASASPGNRFQGGPVVSPSFDLPGLLASVDLRLLIADPGGAVLHEGVAYRAAAIEDLLEVAAVALPGGRGIEVRVLGEPATYLQWRNLSYSDPLDRANEALSGPAADPSGGGLSNQMRFILGLAPADPVSGHLARLVRTAEGRLVFRFPWRDDKPGIVWRVRLSRNLVDWTETIYDSGIDGPPALEAGWAVVPVAEDGESRVFVRLEVVAP